jgi:hypothetical protein
LWADEFKTNLGAKRTAANHMEHGAVMKPDGELVRDRMSHRMACVEPEGRQKIGRDLQTVQFGWRS